MRPNRGLDPFQQPAPGGPAAQAHQVQVDTGLQQAPRLEWLDPHWQQQSLLTRRVVGEGGLPLRSPVVGLEVGSRQHRDRPPRLAGLVHAADPGASRTEVPCLQHRRMTGRFQLPGDPLRPCPIHLGVADEEVGPGRACPFRHRPARSARGLGDARKDRLHSSLLTSSQRTMIGARTRLLTAFAPSIRSGARGNQRVWYVFVEDALKKRQRHGR